MRQEANRAIAELIQSKDFKQCIAKIKPEHLQEDLASEVYLALLETKPEVIAGLHERKELRFYAARIIFNMACSNTSPFYKKFRKTVNVYTEYGFVNDESYNSYYTEEGEVSKGKYNEDLFNYINTDVLFNECEVIDRKKMELLAFSFIDRLYWYDAKILKLYLYYGDYRSISRETKIPLMSIYCTAKKAIKEIKAMLVKSEVPKDEEINALIDIIEKSLKSDCEAA